MYTIKISSKVVFEMSMIKHVHVLNVSPYKIHCLWVFKVHTEKTDSGFYHHNLPKYDIGSVRDIECWKL